jgi:hypothetical protein
LTGNFDPALTGEINAGVWIGGLISDIRQSPKTGAKVIVVIQDAQWKGKTVYMIPNGGASFLLEIDCNDTFPPSKERPCLFEVTGFEDPKVTETIENLRKLRGKQREESEENAENKKVEEK